MDQELINIELEGVERAYGPAIGKLCLIDGELQQRLRNETKQAIVRYLDNEGSGVRDWRTIEHSNEFKQWLRGIDQLTGQVRQRVFDRAMASGDAGTVAATFSNFKSAKRSSEIHGTVIDPEPPKSTFVPGRAYSRAEVAALYAARQRGDYIGREREWQEIERDIVEGGKVTGGYPVYGK